jgi:hypothetical protein
VCESDFLWANSGGEEARFNRACQAGNFPVLTIVTGWYCGGTPPPPPGSIETIELERNVHQVYDSKGFNLQSIQNKGVGSESNLCFPLGSMSYNLLSLAKYRLQRA